jgi:drug/metabolite transporter (DMT)-like permease
MIFLALAILGSGLIPVIFRAFEAWRVNVYWAIPVNYLTCALVGRLWSGQDFDFARLSSQPWIGLAVLQGVILAVNFYLLAYTAQRAGVAVAALASRLSVAIPAILAFFIYSDTLSAMKIVGLGAALSALYLCTAPDGRSHGPLSAWIKLLPVLVFVTFGCYFTVIKYAQAHYLDEASYHAYVVAGFLFAFLTSLAIGFGRRLLAPSGFSIKHCLAGLFLGTINYAAVYALIKMLALEGWQSSQLYPIYSVGVVAVSTLLAMMLFHERLSKMKTVGLFVGLAAVALLNQ